MIRNYLTIAYRNLLKHKIFSFINIAGLAIGLTACLLIFQYVYFELSYDRFHTQKSRLFRVTHEEYATTTMTLAGQMQQALPEVVRATRVWPREGTIRVQLGEEKRAFQEKNIFYTDANFLRMFSFPLRFGQSGEALAPPYSVVLTLATAQKYFGRVDESVLGETLTVNNMFGQTDYQVRGILEPLPANSHLSFDLLFSFDRQESEALRSMGMSEWNALYTYALLSPEATASSAEEKLNALVRQHDSSDHPELLRLQPLSSVYFSDFAVDTGPIGDQQTVYIFASVAVFMLLIAWINYINLATARAVERSREVGIRKAVGGQRSELIWQFLWEVILFSLISGIAALTLFQATLPLFSQLLNKRLAALSILYEPTFWIFFLALLLAGALLSGIYPAFVLSSYQPISVLKGKLTHSSSGIILRKGLVIIQFAASVALIGSTFVVYQQLHYMREKDLGVDLNRMVYIEAPTQAGGEALEENGERLSSFKQTIRRLSSVQQVARSSFVPGNGYNYSTQAQRQPDRLAEAPDYAVLYVDAQYLPLYDVALLAGRYFSDGRTEGNNLIINQTALRQLGFTRAEEAVGNTIYMGYAEGPQRIIGVVEDYHNESLHAPYWPLIFRYDPAGNFSVKLASDSDVTAAVAQLEAVYNDLFPGNPFTYFFLDAHFDTLYRTDRQRGILFGIFASLAIFIACLGLFGLTVLTTHQKTKEIGIRKVLGASVASILRLLYRDFAGLVVMANLLALPVILGGMREWLKNYAFAIELSASSFVVPVLIVTWVGLFTIGIQALKAAHANPVEALRNE